MSRNPLYQFDSALAYEGFRRLCGVDEAGRGPLAGPVACAAVILNPALELENLNDSKKLSETTRETLFRQIVESCVEYRVILIDHQTIDRINILAATMLGMKQAVESLQSACDLVLIDGNRSPDLKIKSKTVIHGDRLSASVAAASILAKVTRDRYMTELSKQFPEYGFEQHKGYPTKQHYENIERYGFCEYHRKSFLKSRVAR